MPRTTQVAAAPPQARPTGNELVVAVPKGRVLKQLIPHFASAGIDTSALRAESRQLIRNDTKRQVSFLLLKPDDVPTYVEYGAADIGVVGRDVLLERDYDLYAPLDLGIGKCAMYVCGLPGSYPREEGVGRTLRVGTKFTNIAERHFRRKGIHVETIFCQGSVELAPLTGLADVIVDLVETGETLRQNGLVPLEHVVDVSSVLVANRSAFKLKRSLITPILTALDK